MTWIDLVPAFISGLVSIGTCVATNAAQMKKRDIEQDKQMLQLQAAFQQNVAVIGCKIDELDRKQEIHNKVIERVYRAEERLSVHEEQIRELKKA